MFTIVAAGAFAALSGSARAEDALAGTWATPRDSKGIYAHIEVRHCGGGGMCGVIARTYDQEDHQVNTKNLGVRIFWDMLPEGQGLWKGWAYVPLYKKTLKGQITMQNRRNIKVGGCLGPVCKSQKWSRVW